MEFNTRRSLAWRSADFCKAPDVVKLTVGMIDRNVSTHLTPRVGLRREFQRRQDKLTLPRDFHACPVDVKGERHPECSMRNAPWNVNTVSKYNPPGDRRMCQGDGEPGMWNAYPRLLIERTADQQASACFEKPFRTATSSRPPRSPIGLPAAQLGPEELHKTIHGEALGVVFTHDQRTFDAKPVGLLLQHNAELRVMDVLLAG